MHFGRPLWKSDLAGVLVRIPLGGYFILIGRHKLNNMESFVATVKKINLLPDQLATLYAILLPYTEVGVGVLLVIGLWTTLASILSSLMLASFIFAIGLFPIYPEVYNKDFLLLGASLSLLASGAGAFSVDTFRTKG
jgi:uncharacterized membrane protein YphA (DoxX/SURF4 family)